MRRIEFHSSTETHVVSWHGIGSTRRVNSMDWLMAASSLTGIVTMSTIHEQTSQNAHLILDTDPYIFWGSIARMMGCGRMCKGNCLFEISISQALPHMLKNKPSSALSAAFLNHCLSPSPGCCALQLLAYCLPGKYGTGASIVAGSNLFHGKPRISTTLLIHLVKAAAACR